MNYIMVRIRESKKKNFDYFLNKNVVAIGWSKVNFKKFEKNDLNELKEQVEKEYSVLNKTTKAVKNRKLNQIERFFKINAGDRIIIPNRDLVYFAIAEDETVYDKDALDADLANQKKVFYLHDIVEHNTQHRKDLSEELQKRLTIRGTVFYLDEFENELKNYFE